MLDSMTARPDTISVQIEPPFAARVDEQALAALARRVLASEQVDSPAELSVFVTDDETVRGLNKRYREIDTETDVLSFRMDGEEGFVTPPKSAEQLGEVVIAFPTALRQAEEAGHDIGVELAHLLAHGILHLLGYDHEAAAEAKLMRSKEEALLGGAAH